VLTFAPDFVYLHDNFALRMNTVFKLYYQGWILFSLAAAFAVWSVLAGGQAVGERKPKHETVRPAAPPVLVGRFAFAAVALLVVIAGMTYPVLAAQGRALVDTGRLCDKAQMAALGSACPPGAPLTLDGRPSMISPSEYAAVQCLNRLETGDHAVVAEAPGGAYEPWSGRFSGLTGIPTLMGWQNHERQWRGVTYDAVTDKRYENGAWHDRVSDVEEMYTTQDWATVWATVDRYGIDYVVVGEAERRMVQRLAGSDPARLSDYTAGLAKFEQVLTPVCAFDTAVVYRVKPS
jgi:uncharacterized membrane protein